MTILGLVIAGGRSARFGSDKALALVDGQPMIARVVQVLQLGGCADLAVNAPLDSAVADWALAEGLAVLPDPPGRADGPLSGVLAGLGWAAIQNVPLLATAPCDTPWLPFDMVPRLAAGLSDTAGAVAAVTSAGSHPLCAVWRVDRAADLALLMDDKRHPPVRATLDMLDAVFVEFPDATAFANVNTVADLICRPSRSPQSP